MMTNAEHTTIRKVLISTPPRWVVGISSPYCFHSPLSAFPSPLSPGGGEEACVVFLF